MRLLIEEDELDLAGALTVFFEKNHFSVDAVNDGLLRWFLPLYTRITAAVFFDICSCFSIYDLSVVLRRENNVVLAHVHRYSLLEPRLKTGVPNIKRDGNAHWFTEIRHLQMRIHHCGYSRIRKSFRMAHSESSLKQKKIMLSID